MAQKSFFPKRLPSAILGLGLLLLASVRIVLTYRVFTQTVDEPAHIAAGMEWLDLGSYLFEPLHPPLARVASALGPFLEGVRLPATQRLLLTDLRASGALRNRYGVHEVYDNLYLSTVYPTMWNAGNEILHSGGRYWHHLSLARLGILPFFLLASCVVWFWARRLFGNCAAMVSLLLFTSLPPVLAHGGLATTDMALTASLAAACLVFSLWLERPTPGRSALVGVAAGMTLLSKLSAVLFLPMSALAILVVRASLPRPPLSWAGVRRGVSLLILAAGGAFLVLWAGYRFSLAPLAPISQRPHAPVDSLLGSTGTLHDLAYSIVEAPVWPAVEILDGLDQLWSLDASQLTSRSLDRSDPLRWLYFFPLAIVLKTPLAFLVLCIAGLAGAAVRSPRPKSWQALVPGAVAGAILLAAMASRFNIGLRHVLPIYPSLAILGGYGASRLWNLRSGGPVGRVVVVALLGWQVFSSLAAHPDYLPYFNELASPELERKLVGSDLDWGQDLARLADELRRRDVDSISIAYFGSADLAQHGLPAYRILSEGLETDGWVAISMALLVTKEGYHWLESFQPVSIVGKSIVLYHIEGSH